MPDRASGLVCAHDLTGRIEKLNHSFEVLTGYTRGEARAEAAGR